MDDRGARDYVKRNQMQCPRCGGPVLVAIDGDASSVEAMRLLKASGARFALVDPEAAEEEIRERDFKPVDPLGGEYPHG